MDKFLETHKLQTLMQEKIENLNRSITSKETKSVIKHLPTQKTPGQVVSQGNSTKNFKKN